MTIASKGSCSKGVQCPLKLHSSKEGKAKDKDQESPLSGIILVCESMAKRREKFFSKRRSPSVLRLHGRDIVVRTESATPGISCTVNTSR